jgi:Na+/H+ antiporter NhaA
MMAISLDWLWTNPLGSFCLAATWLNIAKKSAAYSRGQLFKTGVLVAIRFTMAPFIAY